MLIANQNLIEINTAVFPPLIVGMSQDKCEDQGVYTTVLSTEMK